MPRRCLAVLAAALGLAACAGGGAGAPRGAAPLAADVPHLEERALLLLLADRRTFDSFTVGRLVDGPPAVREALAEALGRIGDRQGRGTLELLAADPAVEVRRAALFALGELEDPVARPALLRAAADADREAGRLAVEALGKLGAPVLEVAAALERLEAGERQARLLPALFRFKGEEAVPLAAAGLEADDPELRSRAAYALAREPRQGGPPLLRPLLADPDPWVRGWAARALGGQGEAADLARLRPLLDDADPGAIVQALRAARRLIADGKAAAPADWRQRLLELMGDPRPGVALTALEAASAWLLDRELGEALVAVAASGAGRSREVALLALAQGKDPRAAELTDRASRSPDAVLRARAAEAAALLGPSGARVLGRLWGDARPGVRAAALAARLQEEAQDGLAAAREALADPDPVVRAGALEWLGEHPRAAVGELREALGRAAADRLPDALLAGIAALQARAEAEEGERGDAVAALEELASHPDYLVRRRCAPALAALGRAAPAPGPAVTAPGIETYRDLVRRTARAQDVALETERGTLRLRLACPRAPLTCLNFLQLGGQGYFDGLTFHRVVPDFVVQGGDPRGDGAGGPGYSIRDEINRLRYRRGVVGMALSGPDTGGSQFFVALSPQPHLDGGYTAFGEVVAGDEVLDAIVQGDRIERVVILGAVD